jgi:hypothetical protein
MTQHSRAPPLRLPKVRLYRKPPDLNIEQVERDPRYSVQPVESLRCSPRGWPSRTRPTVFQRLYRGCRPGHERAVSAARAVSSRASICAAMRTGSGVYFVGLWRQSLFLHAEPARLCRRRRRIRSVAPPDHVQDQRNVPTGCTQTFEAIRLTEVVSLVGRGRSLLGRSL